MLKAFIRCGTKGSELVTVIVEKRIHALEKTLNFDCSFQSWQDATRFVAEPAQAKVTSTISYMIEQNPLLLFVLSAASIATSIKSDIESGSMNHRLSFRVPY